MEYFIKIFFKVFVFNPLILDIWPPNQYGVEGKNKDEELNDFLSNEDLPSTPPGDEKKLYLWKEI